MASGRDKHAARAATVGGGAAISIARNISRKITQLRGIPDEIEGQEAPRLTRSARATTTVLERNPVFQARKKTVILLSREDTSQSRMSDTFDAGAETVMKHTVEEPVCLQACQGSERCQFFCYPAQYATRRRRTQLEDANGGHDEETDVEHRRFGLPDFDDAGFSILPSNEVQYQDDRVASKLGLRVAIHKKTSVYRFVYVHSKAQLPSGIGPEKVRKLVCLLAKCDHINILRCLEVCEDSDSLYLLYEYWPCVTLFSVLETHTWTQEQASGVARECAAAFTYAHQRGLYHLGVTFYHVLLPPSAGPAPVKVFGFGLLGVLVSDTCDHMCWAPEAMEKYNQKGNGTNFVTRLDGNHRACCDSWSLGTLVYAVAGRRPPIVGSAECLPAEWLMRYLHDDTVSKAAEELPDAAQLQDYALQRGGPLLLVPAQMVLREYAKDAKNVQQQAMMLSQKIMARKWVFTLDFDALDAEVRSVIEDLLHQSLDKRIRPEQALRSEWIRRWWRPPATGPDSFLNLEEFCNGPLAKRLFARFLVRFLDAEHLRAISKAFVSMDSKGDGFLDSSELRIVAKRADRPESAAQAVLDWLAVNDSISLSRFAESLAEEVIDGRALRHAFESLDDDGSEQISADELFDALSALDKDVTMEQVVAHIESAELEACGEDGEEDTKDHQIDFSEFVRLFPVYVQRTNLLEARAESTRSSGTDAANKFHCVQDHAKRWLDVLKGELDKILELSPKLVDKREQGIEVANQLKKHFATVTDALKNVPGPQDPSHINGAVVQKRKHPKKRQNAMGDENVFGFGSFLQDRAAKEQWHNLIADDFKMLKLSVQTHGGDRHKSGTAHFDPFRAHDAAEGVVNKLKEVIEWATAQFEEYESFVEVFDGCEHQMPSLSFSGRGLQQSGDDDDIPGDVMQAMTQADGVSESTMARLLREATIRPMQSLFGGRGS